MTVDHAKVGPNRYRERFGRYYEDFVVGDIYEHRPGRTLSEVDNTWFTLLTMNTHPMHFDAEFAKHSEFGRCHHLLSSYSGGDRRAKRDRCQPKGHRQSWLDQHPHDPPALCR